jgi:hypothetical protein
MNNSNPYYQIQESSSRQQTEMKNYQSINSFQEPIYNLNDASQATHNPYDLNVKPHYRTN